MCPVSFRRYPPSPPDLPLPMPLDLYRPYHVDIKREALSNYGKLEQKLAVALTRLDSGSFDADELKSTLNGAQEHVAGMREFLAAFVDSEVYNEKIPEGSNAAQRTFDVPELFEMIMCYLPITDVLNMSQTSRNMKASIDGSSKLQTHLSLRAAPENSHLQMPFKYGLIKRREPIGRIEIDALSPIFLDNHVGFHCRDNGLARKRRYYLPTEFEDNNVTEKERRTLLLHASFAPLAHQQLPRFGSHIRDMFVCQPPIKKMSVILDCCSSYAAFPNGQSEEDQRPVQSPKGLTIGDLYDRAEELMKKHRWCPNGHLRSIDDDGMVEVGVRFAGEMVLQPDDPILMWETEKEDRYFAENQRRALQNAKLEAYSAARRTAHTNGQVILTLTEFLAQHPEDTDWLALAYPQSVPPFIQPVLAAPPPPPNAWPPPFPYAVPPLPAVTLASHSALPAAPPPRAPPQSSDEPDVDEELDQFATLVDAEAATEST